MKNNLPAVFLYLFLGGFHASAERCPVHVLQFQAVAHQLREAPFLPIQADSLMHHPVAFQTSFGINTDVAVARKPFLPYSRHNCLYLRHLGETHCPEVPGGAVGIHQTAHVEQQTCAPPLPVLYSVPSLSTGISCLAGGCTIEGHGMSLVSKLETDVPTVAGILEQGEHRTVAGFQPVGRCSSVKCPCIAVIAVHAHHHVVVRHILHFPCRQPVGRKIRAAVRVVSVCCHHSHYGQQKP